MLTEREQVLTELLTEIYDDLPIKSDGVCPVCNNYTHKVWCWYPRLCKELSKPLDNFDKEHIEKAKKHGK